MIHRPRRSLPAAALVFAALGPVACGSGGTADTNPSPASQSAAAAVLDPAAATIAYVHRDGSIPPPGYRERRLTVTPESSRLEIADRQAILEEATVPTDPAAVDRTLALLAESDLPPLVDDDCVGGPSYELEVTDAAGAPVREIRIYCPLERPTADDEIRAIVAPLLEQFERR